MVREAEVLDYRATVEPLLPLAEASYVQLEPGPAPTNLAGFSSDKVAVLGIDIHAAAVGINIVKGDCVGFYVWAGDEECRINGQLTRHNLIYAQGGQDGFHIAGGARRAIGVVLRRSDFIETLAALRGVGPEDVRLRRVALELTPEAASRARTELAQHLGSATGRGRHGLADVNLSDPSEAIFALLVDAYLRSPPVRERHDRPICPEQIVRKAEDRFFAAEGGRVSLADLCAATGVSQSTLYRAFHAVCDQAPLAYFHKRRLTEARRALIQAPPCRGAVKRAALTAGLTELGRFSVEYRQLFGVSPSATLRKSSPP